MGSNEKLLEILMDIFRCFCNLIYQRIIEYCADPCIVATRSFATGSYDFLQDINKRIKELVMTSGDTTSNTDTAPYAVLLEAHRADVGVREIRE